jgi:hypothetical protein
MSFNFYKNEKTAAEAATQKPGLPEYVYVLMLILLAGRATSFFESSYIGDNPVWTIIPVIFSGIIAFRWKVFFNAQFYGLLFIFAVYFIAVSIKFYVIQPTFLITYYFLFFIAYVAVRSLKFDLFVMYEKLLYYFAIISLVMWSVQVVLGGDTVYNIFARSAYLRSVSMVSGDGVSAIFYSVQPYATTLINNYTISRNCGFAWEPGSYAVYLCLGIYVNLFISPRDKENKKRFRVLLIALLSTMSTTGYAILSLIMIFYFINRDFKKILLLLPVMAAALIFLFSLPFMKNKIIEMMGQTNSIDQIVRDSYARERPTTPQRFASFMIAYVDFKNNPVLGLAAHYEESWVYKIGSRVSPISGIGNLMAQFGIVGLLFFIILSVRSSILFARYFKYKGKLALFLILLGISVSYSVILVTLIMCFWMFQFFEPDILPEAQTAPVEPAIRTDSV